MAESTRKQSKENFLEQIGDRDIELGDYKVDKLRQIASEVGVSGSHDMHKPELVEAINKARKSKR
jgi:superoxide dismutase